MGLLFMQPDLATSGKLHCFFKERRAGKAVVSIVFNTNLKRCVVFFLFLAIYFGMLLRNLAELSSKSSNVSALSRLRQMMSLSCRPNLVVKNSLLSSLAKLGHWQLAMCVFGELGPSQPDVRTSASGRS